MDVLNFSAAERVDLSDLNFAAQESPLGFARELGQSFAVGSGNAQKMWVINGFKATNPAGNQIQVALGSAFLARRVGLDVSYGVLTATGDATQSIDVTSFQPGTYGVYVTFTQVPGEYQNRTFWQAGDVPGEYAQSVPTKLLSTWQMTITGLNPGVEWLQVASLTLPNNQLADTRPLYFEGSPQANYASTWGTGTNDRSADRATYGVGDLQTMLAALRTAIEDVKGPGLTRWWENKVGGQNIGFAGTPLANRTAWGDSGFFAQGDTNAPYLSFAPNSALAYDRNAAAFLLSANAKQAASISALLAKFTVPVMASSATYPQSIVDNTDATTPNTALQIQAASGTASVLFAPKGTQALFEQRATNAATSSLATYAGTTLAGSVDASGNWILGRNTAGYAYPNATAIVLGGGEVVTNIFYAALTLADTSGNHLLRMDSSGKAGVPALASLRANGAVAGLRFTPTATTLSATYNFQLAATPSGNNQATFTLGTAFRSHLLINQADDVLDCSGAISVKAQAFVPSNGFYDCYPSIYNMRLASGTTNGAIQASQNGGYLQVVGTPNIYGQTVLIPVQLPKNATINAVYLNFWHSGANGTSLVQMTLWGSKFTSLQSALPQAVNLANVQRSINSSGQLQGNSLAITSLNITPGTYFNYFVSFGDYDTNGVDEIVSCHIYYNVPSIGEALV